MENDESEAQPPQEKLKQKEKCSKEENSEILERVTFEERNYLDDLKNDKNEINSYKEKVSDNKNVSEKYIADSESSSFYSENVTAEDSNHKTEQHLRSEQHATSEITKPKPKRKLSKFKCCF